MKSRCYSYLRFSSAKQRKGSSADRQRELAAAWASKNGYVLDESLKLQDLGVSAFRGDNIETGRLGVFLDAVKTGKVPPGSVLLVENLDRLSRQDVWPCIKMFGSVLEAGIEVVTFAPDEERWTLDKFNDLSGILRAVVYFSRAHDSSAMMSSRGSDVWARRRKNAAVKPMTGVCPAWLKLVGGKWQLMPDRVETVKLIFQLSRDGYGLHAITTELVARGVPPMGRASHWAYSYVRRILKSRTVLGEHQPCQGKKPVGPPVPNYFPAVITEAEWYAAQSATTSRKKARGPKGKHVRNLFTGLLLNARDGETLVTVTAAPLAGTEEPRIRLISAGATRGESYRSVPYDWVEQAVLGLVYELKASDLRTTEQNGHEAEITVKAGRLEELGLKIENLKKRLLSSPDFEAGLDLLAQLEAEQKILSPALDALRAEATHSTSETLGETQTLIQLLAAAPDEQKADLRTRLKQRIKNLVAEMWLVGWSDERKDAIGRLRKDRKAELQIFLRDGTVYQIFINREGAAGGPIPWKSGIIPQADLRNYRNADWGGWYEK